MRAGQETYGKTRRSRHAATSGVKTPASDFWNTRWFLIWIGGYQTAPMSPAELWQISGCRLVFFLSVALGCCVGISGAIIFELQGYAWLTYAILFAVAPLVINIGSAALATLYVAFRRRKIRDPRSSAPIIVPSFVPIFICAVPVMTLILNSLVLVDKLITIELWAVAIFAVAYTIISDFFHYLVFHFVAPHVWKGTDAVVYAPVPDTVRPVQSVKPLPREETRPRDHDEATTNDRRVVNIGKTRISEEDVLFLEAQGNYLRVVTEDQNTTERFKISEAVSLLDETLGIMVHRSRWVAFAHISGVKQMDKSSMALELSNGEMVKVAASRISEVKAALAVWSSGPGGVESRPAHQTV